MSDETGGANPTGGTPPDDLTAKLATLTTENESLKRTQTGLQRELERVRQQGGNIKSLEVRLQANEDAQVAVLEAVGAIATAGELKDVATKVQAVVEQIRKQRTSAPPPEVSDSATKAGAEIVSAADGAGISEEKFEESWKSDPRFVEARALWRAGSHDAAAVAFKTALTRPTAKTFTEDDIKKRVDEELAKARRSAAPPSSPASTATGTDRTIKASDIAKMPADERVKFGKDLRAALKG